MSLKHILFASAFIAAAAPALAQTPNVNVGGGALTTGAVTNANIQHGQNAAISTGNIGSNSHAAGGAGGQGGIGLGGVGQGGTGQGGTGQGGAATVQNHIGSVGGIPSTIRNTPNSTLALATAYCGNTGGVSGSGPGFSFGVAMGKHDIDCKRVQYAVALMALGQTEAALLVMANNQEVNAALHEAARQRAEAAKAQPAAVRPGYCEPLPNESAADRLMRLRNCQG